MVEVELSEVRFASVASERLGVLLVAVVVPSEAALDFGVFGLQLLADSAPSIQPTWSVFDWRSVSIYRGPFCVVGSLGDSGSRWPSIATQRSASSVSG